MARSRDRATQLIAKLPSMAAAARGPHRLAALLVEDGSQFAGLAADETDWLRGHIYAALALGVVPPSALKAAREDLGTSSSPIVLAGIARLISSGQPGADWVPAIDEAAKRIRFEDIYPEFLFDAKPTCCKPARTALAELAAARAAAGGRAISHPKADKAEHLGMLAEKLLGSQLEDQSRHILSLGDLLQDHALLIVPFYTRCMNPLKCSLAVSRLGQAKMEGAGIARIGLTYDPAFDSAHRLWGYGTDRGFPFGAASRLVRCKRGWPALRSGLQLRAGYGTSTVNAHARELLLIEKSGDVWRLPADWLANGEKVDAHRRFWQPPIETDDKMPIPRGVAPPSCESISG